MEVPSINMPKMTSSTKQNSRNRRAHVAAEHELRQALGETGVGEEIGERRRAGNDKHDNGALLGRIHEDRRQIVE